MADVKIHPDHIVRAPWTDTPIPDTDIYTFMFERESVRNAPPTCNPDRLAFIDGPSGKSITYRRLKKRIEFLSRGLAKGMNIKRGDAVCFYMPNHIDYPTALWAALRLGAVPSCANPIYTAHELVHQLKLSKSKCIITHPAFLQSATEAARMVGLTDSKIFLVERGNASSLYLTVGDLVRIGKSAPEIAPLKLAPGEAENKVALLNFSSGTSGLPKGVLITHRNVIANVCQLSAMENGMNLEGEVSNGCLPFFHIYGLVMLMHYQLSAGVAIVIQPSFAPDAFVQDIHKYKITMLFVVPPIMQALLHRVSPDKMNFNPPLRTICCGAAPLPQEIVPKLQKIWPTCLMRQGWGMTETAVAVTITPIGSPLEFSHTCGPLLPNAEAVIIDPKRGVSIAAGKGQGELWVRAPSVTLGYISNPKETKEMFDIGGQGWMRSGDEAEFEMGKVIVNGAVKEEWLLCIRDRLKELIKVSGNQVAPAELENVLAAHPSIADQAVVGKPDERRGEVPWAFIVKKHQVSKKEIMDWVKTRTSKYKHLGGVTFVDQITKNPSGKILKRVYREMFKKAGERGVSKAKL